MILMLIRLEPSEQSPLKPYLLLDPEEDRGVDFEFISEAVKRFDEDESIKPAFIAAVEGLSQELAEMNINDDYKPYVTVCEMPSCHGSPMPINIPLGLAESCPSRGYCRRDYRVIHFQCVSGPSTV